MKIHFIGICGVAMGSLALAMKKQGHEITGSDVGFFPPISTYLKENPFLNIKLLAMNTTDLVEIRDVIFSIARHFLKKGYGYTVFTLSMNYLDLLKLIPKNVGKLVYNNFVFQKGNHQFINKCNYFYSFSWTG